MQIGSIPPGRDNRALHPALCVQPPAHEAPAGPGDAVDHCIAIRQRQRRQRPEATRRGAGQILLLLIAKAASALTSGLKAVKQQITLPRFLQQQPGLITDLRQQHLSGFGRYPPVQAAVLCPDGARGAGTLQPEQGHAAAPAIHRIKHRSTLRLLHRKIAKILIEQRVSRLEMLRKHNIHQSASPT